MKALSIILMVWALAAAAAVPVLCIAGRLRIPRGRLALIGVVVVVGGLALLFTLPNTLRPLAVTLVLPPSHLIVFAGVSGIFEEITGRKLELTPVLFIRRENAIDYAFTQVALALSLVISGLVLSMIRV